MSKHQKTMKYTSIIAILFVLVSMILMYNNQNPALVTTFTGMSFGLFISIFIASFIRRDE